jgi:hypothetical protein
MWGLLVSCSHGVRIPLPLVALLQVYWCLMIQVFWYFVNADISIPFFFSTEKKNRKTPLRASHLWGRHSTTLAPLPVCSTSVPKSSYNFLGQEVLTWRPAYLRQLWGFERSLNVPQPPSLPVSPPLGQQGLARHVPSVLPAFLGSQLFRVEEHKWGWMQMWLVSYLLCDLAKSCSRHHCCEIDLMGFGLRLLWPAPVWGPFSSFWVGTWGSLLPGPGWSFICL